MLTNFIRRILGTDHFPLAPVPLGKVEPQVYQPPVVPKPLTPQEPHHGIRQ